MRSFQPHRTGYVATAVGVVAAALLTPVTPATAATTTLCTGYQRCAAQGRSTSGYSRANVRMYWQMYSGHNCTNYVAYRMVRKGMANRRPWTGPGNATHWGKEMPRRTDRRPAVGSVAWWPAGTPRGGSSGHVAYVERVVSRSEIVVSQDSWSGDFSWARITRSSGWPTGFIHLRDTPLRRVSAPQVTGTRRVGETLVASRGSWSPKPASVRYQWLVGGKPVAGGGSRRMRLTPHMLGKRVRVRTVASRVGYPRNVATSRATGKVGSGRLRVSHRPALTGRAQVTRTLRVSPGSWSPRPARARYQWFADGDRIRRATSPSLRVGPGLAERRVYVRVVVRRAGYTPRLHTLPAGRVDKARLRPDRRPQLGGTPDRGATLRVRLGQTGPRASVRRVTWLRDGTPMRGIRARSYRLGRDDLGSRVRAQVTYRRKGFHPLTITAGTTGRVKTVPRVTTTAQRRRHAVRLLVTGRGAGRPLSTEVVVLRPGRVLDRGTMRRGTAVLRLTGLRPGRRVVRIVVRGTPRTERYVVTRAVRVPR